MMISLVPNTARRMFLTKSAKEKKIAERYPQDAVQLYLAIYRGLHETIFFSRDMRNRVESVNTNNIF